MTKQPLLPADWNPKQAGDRVLAKLTNVCLPRVKGAHDSDLVIRGGKAYIVYMANDIQPGEGASWPFVYSALSVVDLASGRVEHTETFAAGEMKYGNTTLPVGACFVPRIIAKDERTLRCFFASEQPGKRQAQSWCRDLDTVSGRFAANLQLVELETDQGVFPMQPQYFQRHGAAKGFQGPEVTYGLYAIDSFKRFGGQNWAVLNNFIGGQLAWARLNDSLDRFTVVGDFFLPDEAKLTESAVQQMPDGSFLAISRQENRDHNYMFARSQDGKQWSPHEYLDLVPNGASSKSTFERFGDVYYLGWQEATRINGIHRSVFNVDVSSDGVNWQRKYRFETDQSFQYPVFRLGPGAIYLTVTQGDVSDSRKERIMFGKLEDLPAAG